MSRYLRFDSPIHNLQVFLRTISNKYSEIPSVIPDGVYGDSTKAAVSAFQEKFLLNSTGVTDNSTWDSIINVYKEIEEELSFPVSARVFPEIGLREDNNSYIPTIYVIQTMLLALSEKFSNIPAPSVNGILDSATTEAVKALQISSGLNPDGNITKIFWNYLSVIYETFVSNDRADTSGLTG